MSSMCGPCRAKPWHDTLSKDRIETGPSERSWSECVSILYIRRCGVKVAVLDETDVRKKAWNSWTITFQYCDEPRQSLSKIQIYGLINVLHEKTSCLKLKKCRQQLIFFTKEVHHFSTFITFIQKWEDYWEVFCISFLETRVHKWCMYAIDSGPSFSLIMRELINLTLVVLCSHPISLTLFTFLHLFVLEVWIHFPYFSRACVSSPCVIYPLWKTAFHYVMLSRSSFLWVW